MGNTCSGSPKRGSVRDLGKSFVTGASSSVLGKTHDPAFKWKVYGFSALLEKGTIPAYSDFFHCSGYTWYLKLSPMDKQSGTEIPYVALSLCLSQNNIKEHCTIKAVFEISIYNHSNGTYCGYQASYKFRFKKIKSDIMWLIPLEELLKSSDFLVDNSCVFGVRVMKAGVSSPKKNTVVAPERPISVQNLFLQKEFIKGTYTWTSNNFLDLKQHLVFSPAFKAVGHTWYITVYPRGDCWSTSSLSMYLRMQGSNELTADSGMMIDLTLSILDQEHGNKHLSRQAGRVVFAGTNAWGWNNFIPLKTLKDPSKGYLVGSKCIVKADITIIGSTNDA
ncbi:hypothetical protein QOZ80_5AG0365380 [Eleusine coracana subsp. coracana]|nr:hypothetical protein QOZ80_5AG0365380 [Eleusine coracana subsp. coracana]